MTQAGIYIHIPFCRSRCSYCDFATGMYESGLAERYVAAVVSEIQRWEESLECAGLPLPSPASVDTIYFGGGTPSLLTPAQVERILTAVRDRFEVLDSVEITMEMNPGDGGTSTESKRETIGRFFRLGINRASFGAQTFDDRELKQLGRTHAASDIHTTFHQLRGAGFENINFDLIAGLPGQTLAGWNRNLEAALKLRPEHLSLYLLDVHEGTPLFEQIQRRMRPKPDDDLAAEMYRMMIDKVCAAGYEHYEISNFCLPGYESRHNTKYWTGAPYYGFGCSAHSYDGEFHRWANERDTARYVEAIENGHGSIVQRNELSENDVRAESIFLGLRMMRGVDTQVYRARFGADLCDDYGEELKRFHEAGLIDFDNNLIRLTRNGALLSNEVFSVFV
jgi:oxygen-independent coproporphyrinogen III oxidase